MKKLTKSRKALRKAIKIGRKRAIFNPRVGTEPGNIIVKHLSPEDREALKELTSDEIKDDGLPKYD